MIKITVDLWPLGVSELSEEILSFVIGCKFPLNQPEGQDFHIHHGDYYACLKKFNIDVDPPDDWLTLIHAALGEYLAHKREIREGEFFGGKLAIDPDEFDKNMQTLTRNLGEYIQSIKLFGTRAKREISLETFRQELSELPQKAGKPDANGEWLAEHYPGHVGYELEIRLLPALYNQKEITVGGTHYKSLGASLEDIITESYTRRPYPYSPRFRISNGITPYFVRPGGEIANWITGWEMVFTPAKGRVKKFEMSKKEEDYENLDFQKVASEMRHGNLIYSKDSGLIPYPGKRGKC